MAKIWSIIKAIVQLFIEAFNEWNKDKAPRLAAALAYYTIFSIAPLLVVVIAVVGFLLGNEAVQASIIEQVETLMGPQGAETVAGLLKNAYQPSAGIIATIISLVTLLLGAIGVFGQLKDALNTVWGVQPPQQSGIMGFIRDRVLSFGMLLTIGFLLLVSLIVSAAIALLQSSINEVLPGGTWVFNLANLIISYGLITILFAIVFRLLPDIRIEWGDVWIGAFVTALLFNIGKYALGWYIGRSTVTSAYGAAGSLIVILLWVYYTAQILLYGAEFTQVYARKYGSKTWDHKQRIDAQPNRTIEKPGVVEEMDQKPVVPQPVIVPKSRGPSWKIVTGALGLAVVSVISVLTQFVSRDKKT